MSEPARILNIFLQGVCGACKKTYTNIWTMYVVIYVLWSCWVVYLFYQTVQKHESRKSTGKMGKPDCQVSYSYFKTFPMISTYISSWQHCCVVSFKNTSMLLLYAPCFPNCRYHNSLFSQVTTHVITFNCHLNNSQKRTDEGGKTLCDHFWWNIIIKVW